MPQVSVIVPVYKVEPYLRRCVDSILAQTFTDFELILVDDGSPDNCGAICDEYAEKDARVHVIHQENGGLSAARNAGIDWVFANSDSQWLAFVDSDDWVHPNYLAYLYRAVQDSGLKLSKCKVKNISDQNEQVRIIETEEYSFSVVPWDSVLYSCAAWNKLYARELFRELRYPVGKIHEDEFLTYKLIYQSLNVALVDCRLYYYYDSRSGSLNNQPFSLKKMDRVEAFAERLEFFRKRGERRVLPFCLDCYLPDIYRIGRRVESEEAIPPEEQKRVKAQMKNAMRITLLRYSRMAPLRKNVQYYSFAYPITIGALRRAYRFLRNDRNKRNHY